MIAVSMLVGGIDSQADRMWGLATSAGYELLCGGWSHWVGFAPAGSCTCWDHPLSVPFTDRVKWCSVVVWHQPSGVLVLGSLGKGSHVGQSQSLPFLALICHSCVSWLDSLNLKFSSKCLLVMSGDSQVMHEHFHKVFIIFLIVGLLSLKVAPLKTVIATELPVKFSPIPLCACCLLQPWFTGGRKLFSQATDLISSVHN